MKGEIVAPEGMLKAAKDAGLHGENMIGGPFLTSMEAALVGALRWLDAELAKLHVPNGTLWQAGRNVTIGEIRAMFLSPQPEVPKEVRLAIAKHFGANPADWVKELAMDAYRIGRESK